MNEKIASEIKILQEHRRIRLGLPKDGEETSNGAFAPEPAANIGTADGGSSEVAPEQELKTEDSHEDSATAGGDHDRRHAEGEDDVEKREGEQDEEDEDAGAQAEAENEESAIAGARCIIFLLQTLSGPIVPGVCLSVTKNSSHTCRARRRCF